MGHRFSGLGRASFQKILRHLVIKLVIKADKYRSEKKIVKFGDIPYN
jgi:hypothetical protein